jgi:DHA1 family multidrug resistance protein-like MFS transporter
MVRASPYPRLYYELISVGFSLILAMGLSSAFLPLLSWELDPTGVLVGFVTSAWFLARIFTELPSGFLSDRVGRRRLVLFGLALSVAGTIACATSRSIYQLILGRALWGLGAAFYFTNNTALMFDMFQPDRRGKAVGTLQSIEFIGSFIGAPIGAIVATWFGYYSVFYVASAMTALSLSIAFSSKGLRRLGGAPSEGRTAISTGEAIRGLRNWGLIVVCSVVVSRMLVIQGVMSTVFQLYLNQVLLYDVATIGLIMTIRTAGFCVTAFLSGRMVDRLGVKPVISMGLLVEGVCLALYSATGSMTVIAAIGLLEGMGGGMISVTMIVLLSRVVTPRMRGTAIGLYRTFMDLGGILGPIVFTFLYDFVGKATPFLVSSVLLIANIAPVISVRQRHMLEAG